MLINSVQKYQYIMMTPSNSSLSVSGVNLMSDHEVDVNLTNCNELSTVKQELVNCKLENKKLTDQLNCLLSLIKRSWTGDRLATIHLSKIVGVTPIESDNQNGSNARANSADVTFIRKRRCEQNWERLAFKLLEREYLTAQSELRQHQQHYLVNRQLYMDAVLNDHNNSMSRLPLHYRHEKANLGKTNRLRRTQSADNRRMKTAQDIVEKNDFSLHDIIGDTHFTDQTVTGHTSNESYTITPSKYLPRRVQSSTHVRRMPPNTYNDVTRYTQKNLFELNENDVVKKPRPVSASSLIQGDIQRSKPRLRHGLSSDSQLEDKVFITQNNERSLKYETTRPVKAKSKSGKHRKASVSEMSKSSNESTTNLLSASAIKNDNQNVEITGTKDRQEADVTEHNAKKDLSKMTTGLDKVEAKPPTGSRNTSGFVQRPKCVDEFTEDEQRMKDIADEFKKKTMLLQKKLGLCESGFVEFD
ncbi:protein Wnt [Biomphalaria glabrata]|nr:hypothetical protein BgiMline_005770 [Biomphalaria glabrata]KAI8790602.1 hypothetical protein BgiBS90_008526 [Biomphalaria glabrata]